MLCHAGSGTACQIRIMEGFIALSDIFGEELPGKCRPTEYGIRLGDTAFYRYFYGAQMMPADTILAVRSSDAPGIQGDEKKLEELDRHVQLLRAIVEFVPDGRNKNISKLFKIY